MENIFEIVFWKNTVLQWGVATGIALFAAPLTQLVLAFVKNRWIFKFHGLRVIPEKTKSFFLFALFVYLGASFADLILPPVVVKLIRVLLVVSIVTQVGIYGSALIERLSQGFGAANPSAVSLLQFFARLLFFTALAITGLNALGIDVTALVAGLGVGGIAVALAVQNVLGDLLASLSILLDKPFEVGDSITVGDYQGTIEKIGLKTTRIRSASGEELIFSNADLLKSQIRNFKRMTERRVLFLLGVTYQTSQSKLSQIPVLVKQSVEELSQLRFDRCLLKSLGSSSIDFEAVYWVKSQDYTAYAENHHEVLMRILKKFESEKIDFAYPTQTVHQAKS